MNPILGVLFHAIGGLAAGSFYAPCKKIKGWGWETYWLVLGLFAWIIAPLVMAYVLTPGFVGIIKAAPLSVVFWAYFFGVLWGIGGLTFGLTMRFLGISLGVSVALGFCAVFGTLVPPIFAGEFMGLVTSVSGVITLGGVALCLLGITICGKAGMMKERDLSAEEKAEGIAEFDFKKGLWVAIVAGVLSACMAYAFKAGEPIQDLAVEKGVPAVRSNIPLLVVILLGGFTTNFIWCVWLSIKNRTFTDYGKANDGGSLGMNYGLCMFAGVLWYLQFFFYGMGATQMGDYDFASWSLHMAFIIITSNVVGLLTREWKGSSPKTIQVVITGIIVLILSTIVIGLGTKLAA
ncbi:MAG: L-rhamnose/proton symporter RhaT [Planctomycetes bacterium]|nr:L-rhamnose/proton symporter RhaT [Planctomycetota bacterium]